MNKDTCVKVTLRQRTYPNGRISLYLDYYPGVRNPETMKMMRREYLGIYIFEKPKNKLERQFNRDMLYKAEAIRGIHMQSLINEQFDFLDHHKMKKDFLNHFEEMCKKKDEKWDIVYKHFYNFVQWHCTFGDITVELCQNFREYLLNANKLRRKGKISVNSASGYYSNFRGLLKIAYRDKLIKENVNNFLDKIEPQEVKKESLSLDKLSVLLEHRVKASFTICLSHWSAFQQ